MLRRVVVLLVVLALAGVGVLPSDAAVKKKPPYKGSYTLTLYPDPTEEVLSLRGEGCQNVLPFGVDRRPFTVPGAGKLTITLVSPDPTGKGLTDWDFTLMAPDGTAAMAGNGGSSNELATATFKKKGTYELQVCNLLGSTTGTVSWVFKYA